MEHRTRRKLCALLAAALLSLAIGPSFAEAGAVPSGTPDARIAQTLDAYVAEHLDTTAAVAIAVMRGQETLFEKSYGYANKETDTLADAETVYEWGSVTKLLVWVSAMQLAEQGKLDLDQDITAYLPEKFLTKLRYDAKITFMNLMHHNAGFEETIIDLFVPYSAVTGDLEQALRKAEPRQLFQPGEVVGYSNWGVALAGYIVERISGVPFYEYVRQHIFAPLGMERTALHPTLADNEWVLAQRGLVQGYHGTSPAAGTQLAIPLYPAGMATGTLGDFIKFAKALLPDEGETSPLFKEPETLGALLTPSLFYGDSDLARGSHGFWALPFGVTALGHGGNTAAFSSYLLIHPESNTGVVVMTNQGGETIYNAGVPELIFGKFAPDSADGAAFDASSLKGVYKSGRRVETGFTRLYSLMMTIPLLSANGDTLSASIFGTRLLSLQMVAPNVLIEAENKIGLPIAFLYAAETASGTQLQAAYGDFVREPAAYTLFSYALLLLFAIAVCYALVALIAGIVRWLITRKRERRPPLWALRTLMNALTVGVAVNIALLAGGALSYALKSTLNVHLFFNIAYIVVTVGYLATVGLEIVNKRRVSALAIVSGLTGLAVAINILFWQMFW